MADIHLSGTQRTIMVVDDDPELVEILRHWLVSQSFNVRCACSGEDLFAGMEELKPDLVLLDIRMPQMSGLEVLARLKSDPDTATIPVILVSAEGEYEKIIKGYKMGADAYITKPYTLRQLVMGINICWSKGQGASEKTL